MQGFEVRKILQAHHVNLAWLAQQLGLSPQGLNSRLNAQIFKPAYLQEITNVLQKDIFGFATSDAQPIVTLPVCEEQPKDINALNYPIAEYISVPSFVGCVGIVYYSKDALPKYDKGDVIFIKPETQGLQLGKKYLVVTKTEKTIRFVCSGGENGLLRLVALNTEANKKGVSLYPDLEIAEKDILFLYKIVGSISREQT